MRTWEDWRCPLCNEQLIHNGLVRCPRCGGELVLVQVPPESPLPSDLGLIVRWLRSLPAGRYQVRFDEGGTGLMMASGDGRIVLCSPRGTWRIGVIRGEHGYFPADLGDGRRPINAFQVLELLRLVDLVPVKE